MLSERVWPVSGLGRVYVALSLLSSVTGDFVETRHPGSLFRPRMVMVTGEANVQCAGDVSNYAQAQARCHWRLTAALVRDLSL